MSIEQTLERIAVAVETLVAMQQDTKPAPVIPTPGPTAISTAGPPVAAGPAPVAAGPAPVAAGPAPVAAGPAPVAAGPAPVQGVPTLDQITEAANAFHRNHPDRAGEIMAILAQVGASSMSTIPAASYPTVMQQIQALGA